MALTETEARHLDEAGFLVLPNFMSPELLAGAKPDWSCDIWALAVITHEMLTGQRPSFARNCRVVETSLEDRPGCWRDFFNSCLAHEPSQRPESVDLFLKRFERCAVTSDSKWQ